jgi:hypothetical protein
MEDQRYQDFDLLIEPGSRGRYRARVLRSPAGESAVVQFTLPFSPEQLEILALKVGRSGRGTRGRGRPGIAPLKEFGGQLYDAVFQDELRDTLSRSLSQTRAQGMGLRLRLRLTDVPALAGLPWEFLYDRRFNRFLAQSRHTPLVRYLDLPDPPSPLTVDGPLRLLVMISNPRGWPPLEVEQEWDVLTGALAQSQAEGRVVVERMTANMSTLRQRLRREEFHVFHFVGHGYYRSDWGDGVLVMEDAEGGPHQVTGEELGGLLNEYDATRLAVLNACEGAISDASDPFTGMAQSLIQQGLPAVVAMQFEITDEAATLFARELYGAIADGFRLEAALAEARGAIRDVGNATEWGTPVLYSRAPDGRLFDLTPRGRIIEERAVRESAPPALTPQGADRKAREASKVSAWAERRTEEGRWLVVHNGSDEPMYSCTLWLITPRMPPRAAGGLPPTDWRSAFTNVIPPQHDYRHLIPADRLQGSGLKQRPPVEIIFRDSRNQLWWRKGDGAIEQLTPEQGKNYFR